jgi:O-antigen/teichoic acid export membrane protein
MVLAERINKWLQMDQAIAYAILSKVWSLFAGPITLLFISFYLSPQVQGFYYTFLSLLALQSFVELGFYIVVTQFASHEWSNLFIGKDGKISGDEKCLSRLISLGRLIFKWYAWVSTIFIVAVGISGYMFLSSQPAPDISWKAPWLTLVVVAGLQLWAMPFLSLLEGCNQVATVYRFRLIQVMACSLSIWGVMFLGGGLWMASVSSTVALFCSLYLLLIRYQIFFNPFFKKKISSVIDWKTEIWPMQWRLGVAGLLNYFICSIYTPVLFHYHGPVIAGKMGMTWSLIMTLMTLAMAWISTKVPQFGVLIAQKKYVELDRLFFSTSIVSLSVMGVGVITLWFIIYGLNNIQHTLAERLLSPLPASLFLAGIFLGQISQCQTAYLRAHKKEPFFVLNIVYSVCNGLVVWLLAKEYSSLGAAMGYLGVQALLFLPVGTFIWVRCRREWHKHESDL